MWDRISEWTICTLPWYALIHTRALNLSWGALIIWRSRWADANSRWAPTINRHLLLNRSFEGNKVSTIGFASCYLLLFFCFDPQIVQGQFSFFYLLFEIRSLVELELPWKRRWERITITTGSLTTWEVNSTAESNWSARRGHFAKRCLEGAWTLIYRSLLSVCRRDERRRRREVQRLVFRFLHYFRATTAWLTTSYFLLVVIEQQIAIDHAFVLEYAF